MDAEQRAIGAALEVGEILENMDLLGDTKAPLTYNGVVAEEVEKGVIHFIFTVSIPPSDTSKDPLLFRLGVVWKEEGDAAIEAFENDDVLTEPLMSRATIDAEELAAVLLEAVNAGIVRYGFRLRTRMEKAADNLVGVMRKSAVK